MLEKRDFAERLKELRDRSRSLQNGTVATSKVVAAPTPTVPSAKDVMPIDPNWTGVSVSLSLQFVGSLSRRLLSLSADDEIEAMSLAEIKEILKYHGAETQYSRHASASQARTQRETRRGRGDVVQQRVIRHSMRTVCTALSVVFESRC